MVEIQTWMLARVFFLSGGRLKRAEQVVLAFSCGCESALAVVPVCSQRGGVMSPTGCGNANNVNFSVLLPQLKPPRSFYLAVFVTSYAAWCILLTLAQPLDVLIMVQ